MKKMRFVTGVMIAACSICAGMSFAQVTAEAKKQITAGYASMASAYSRKDIEAVTKVFTADYKDINAGKEKDLETWKKESISTMKIIKSMKVTFSTVSYKAKGKDIEVNVKAILDGQTVVGADKKSQSIKEMEIVKDTWTLVKGVWKCKISETLSHKQL